MHLVPRAGVESAVLSDKVQGLHRAMVLYSLSERLRLAVQTREAVDLLTQAFTRELAAKS